MRVIIYFFTSILLSFLCSNLLAQNVANNEYSAASTSIASQGASSENLATGSMSYTIPLTDIDIINGVTMPVNLSYQSGNGIKVNQYHSWVGLGWNTSCNYAITRSIRGKDDFEFDICSYFPNDYDCHGLEYTSGLGNEFDSDSGFATGESDGEPDIFTANLLGQTVTFFLERDDATIKWISAPFNPDIRITTSSIEYSSSDYPSQQNCIGTTACYFRNILEFTVVDQYGFEYIFGGDDHIDFSGSYNVDHQYYQTDDGSVLMRPTKWHLKTIKEPFSNRIVSFTYEHERYSYWNGVSMNARSLRTLKAAPSQEYYPDYVGPSKYTRTYHYGHRLKSIEYADQKIEFHAGTENTALDNNIFLGNRGRMLDLIVILQNDIPIEKYWLRYAEVQGIGDLEPSSISYSKDKNIFLLNEVRQVGVQGDPSDYDLVNNHTQHVLTYYNQTQIPRRCSMAQDWWGYYNGQANKTLIPSLLTTDGNKRFQNFADRRPNVSVVKNGLLKSVRNPAGGTTVFDYESNVAQVEKNFTNKSTISGIITGYQNTSTDNIFSCPLGPSGRATQFSRIYFDVLDPSTEHILVERDLGNYYNSEWDLSGGSLCFTDAIPYGPNLYEYNTTWYLYHVINGNYIKKAQGNTLDNIEFRLNEYIDQPGRYQLSYDATPTSTFEHFSMDFETEMNGAGVRLSKKLMSDDGRTSIPANLSAIDNDDVLRTYVYKDGRWGYHFLPSVEGYSFSNNPIIPQRNDRTAKQAVVSIFRRSPILNFVSPIYYQTVEEYRHGISGHTSQTFTIPNNVFSNGDYDGCHFYDESNDESPLLNQRTYFYQGGLIKYDINNDVASDLICYDTNNSVFNAGRPVQQQIVAADGSVVSDRQINYVKQTNSYPFKGRICRRYVLEQEFNWFWEKKNEEFTTLCYDYALDMNQYQVEDETFTEYGISTKTEYTYNLRNPLLIESKKIFRTNQPSLYSEKIWRYPHELTLLPERQEFMNRNIVGVPLCTENYQGDTNSQVREMLSGEKVDYKLHNNKLVREHTYAVAGGQFILSSTADAWHPTTAIPTRLYYAKQGATTAQSPPNSQYFANHPIRTYLNPTHPDKVDSIKNINRVERYYYFPNGNLQSHISSDSILTSYVYDVLNRVGSMTTDNGRKKVDYSYHYFPDDKYSRLTQIYTFPLDQTLPFNQNQNKEIIYDGLQRETTSTVFNIDGLGNSNGTPSIELLLSANQYNHAGTLSKTISDGKPTIEYQYQNDPRLNILSTKIISFEDDLDFMTKSNVFQSNSNAIIINDCSGGSRTYNPNTLLISTSIDENSGIHSKSQDVFGNVIRSSKKQSVNSWAEVDHFYNLKNQLTCQTDPDNNVYVYTFNTNNEKVSSLLQPEQSNPTKYIYDNLNRLVLVENPKGDKVANVYNDYNQIIKTGKFNGFFPVDLNNLITSTIPDTNLEILSEMSFDGFWSQKSFLTELKEYVIDENDNISNSIFELKEFTNDDIGRLDTFIYHSHIGSIDTTFNTFNDADLLLSSIQKHETPDADVHVFNWTHHHDKGKRSTGLSLNGQQLVDLDYDDLNRVISKNLHKDGQQDNYLQALNYTYDGFGRVSELNSIDDYENINCINNRLCDKKFEGLGDLEQGIYIQDLSIINEVGMTQSIPINYPVFISNNEQDVLNFKSIVEEELTAFIYDDIMVTNNDIIFTQSNILFHSIRTVNTNVMPITENCCNLFDDQNLFAQKINYDKTLVSSVEWYNGCGNLNKYEYHYDQLGRLLVANHSAKSNFESPYIGDQEDIGNYNYDTHKLQQSGDYSTAYQYDDIGNLLKLARRGMIVNQGSISYDRIDDLAYTYQNQSNKLSQVSDLLANRAEGFKNPTTGIANYIYDPLIGHLTNDGQRGMDLTYNRFNEVATASIADGELLNKYNATGRLLTKIYNETTGTTSAEKYRIDHVANTEYRDGQLFALNHADGRVLIKEENTEPVLDFEYHIRDYKDIVRLKFSDKDNDQQIALSDVQQIHNYYPYGLTWDESHVGVGERDFAQYQRGMDWIEELEIYTTEYRTLDPTIASWQQTDPKAADLNFLSPYTSMGANPVMFSDGQGDNPAVIFLVVGVVNTALNIHKDIFNYRAFNKAIRDCENCEIGQGFIWGKVTIHLTSLALNYVLPSSGQFISNGWSAFAYDALVNIAPTVLLKGAEHALYNGNAQGLDVYGRYNGKFKLGNELLWASINFGITASVKLAIGGYKTNDIKGSKSVKELLNPYNNFKHQYDNTKFYGKSDTGSAFGKTFSNINLGLNLVGSVWSLLGTVNHGYIYSGYYISDLTGDERYYYREGGAPWRKKLPIPGNNGQAFYRSSGSPWIGSYSIPQTLYYLVKPSKRPEILQ